MADITNSKILVIGGAGFVGSHIVDQLLDEPVAKITVLDNFVRGTRANLEHAVKDDRVEVVDGSVTDVGLLDRLMADADYIFHLAALWLHECVHEPRSAIDVNVVGTWNVIEAAQRARIKRIVYSSSASVYGNALTTPMTEEHPFNNRTLYGATKIAGEQFFRAFNEQHGLDYVGLRYMNIYGPRMDYKGTYVSVIMKVLDRIEAGEAPIIFGDIARANILAMKANATDENFNIGMGVPTTINELVTMLLELSGSDLEPEYKPEEQSFVTERLGSTEKAEELLGFRAQVPLEEGLASVIEWRKQDQQVAPEVA